MTLDRRTLLAALAGSLPVVARAGVATGGTGRLSYLSALLSSVSPVTVGGVTLNLDHAELHDGEGRVLRPGDLAVGMTGRALTGPIAADKAVAQSLTVDTQVAGPASRLDSQHWLVLGQVVRLGAGVAVPDAERLRVWGQLDLAGARVVASRIEAARADDPDMLRGLLQAIDRGAGTAMVNGLSLRLPGDAPPGLEVGGLVRASLAGAGVAASLRDDAAQPPEGAEVELQGRVTALQGSNRFLLDGLPVDAAHARVSGAALQAGAAVSADGRMRAGVLRARAIEVESGEPLELSGRITALDPVRQRLVVAGRSVRWDDATAFPEGSAHALTLGRSIELVAQWLPGQPDLQALRIALD